MERTHLFFVLVKRINLSIIEFENLNLIVIYYFKKVRVRIDYFLAHFTTRFLF